MTSSRSISIKAVLPALAAALALVLLSACTASGDAAPAPDDPGIRGAITSLSDGSGDVTGSVRIVGAIDHDTSYDRAVVRVESDAKIYRQSWEQWIEVTFADLKVGQSVEAWFTGPVAESYPVQVKASQIVILGEPAD